MLRPAAWKTPKPFHADPTAAEVLRGTGGCACHGYRDCGGRYCKRLPIPVISWLASVGVRLVGLISVWLHGVKCCTLSAPKRMRGTLILLVNAIRYADGTMISLVVGVVGNQAAFAVQSA